MKTLVAHRRVGGEELHFILVDECYSDGGEPFTLFVHANHYSAERDERAREFFHTFEEALDYCCQKYGIVRDEWRSDIRFTHDFRLEYSVTNLGTPQPRLVGFEGGQVIFRVSERQHYHGDRETVLDISGDKEGLSRLAAMLLLCIDGEQYDKFFHVHLEDEAGFILDIPVTLRSPSYFEHLVGTGPKRVL